MATSRISTMRSAAADAQASGSASVTIVGSSIDVASRQLGGQGQRSRSDRIAPASLDRLGEQVDLGPPGRVEPAFERMDTVQPDTNVHGLLLRGDVGAQFGAAPVREEL